MSLIKKVQCLSWDFRHVLTNPKVLRLYVGTLIILDFIICVKSFIDSGLLERASIPLTANPMIFMDDRDGWLRAAYRLVQEGDLGAEKWQVNFWPPGQVAITAALFFLTRNYAGMMIAHTVVSLVLLGLIYAKVLRINIKSTIEKFSFAICLLTLWNFSFFNLSSLTTLVLCPDYLAMLFFTLGLVIYFEMVKTKNFRLKIIIAIGMIFAAASYLRITFYSFSILIWFSLLIFKILSLIRKRKVDNTRRLSVALGIMSITILCFTPWVSARYFIAGNDLKHAITFSEQGRFSMSVAWWNEDYIKSVHAEFIGAGTACKLDHQKCVFFSNRDKLIKDQVISLDWGTDADEKTKQAIKVLLDNPRSVFNMKSKVILHAYFQRIAFSSIDGRNYISLDRIIFLFVFVYSGIICYRSRREQVELLVLYLLGVLWILTLFATQVEFRFLLPSISLLTVPALISGMFQTTKDYKFNRIA